LLPLPLLLHSPSSKPLALSDADKYVVWHDVMHDEIKALHSNHTWSLVPFHPLMNIVGNIDRYKARLVAIVFTQQEGIDYFKTFSPVIKQVIIWLSFPLWFHAIERFINLIFIMSLLMAFLLKGLHETTSRFC
jgi:hypothetical protein